MARGSRVRRARAVPVGVRRPRARGLVLVFLAGTVAACTGDSARSTIQRLRAVLQPPEPPPDTIPEMLDYAGSLGVNIADMKKLPEGVLYDDVVVGGDSLAAQHLRAVLQPPAPPPDTIPEMLDYAKVL